MNILITGGLGHIGSYILRKFPIHWNITIVDNLSSERYCSLFNLDRKIIFKQKAIGEITKKDLHNIDAVLHLASITNAAGSFKDNVKSLLTEDLDSTKHLLKEIKKTNVKYFLFPSTTSIYGKAALIISENDTSAINPQSPYAQTKVDIEKLIEKTLDNTATQYVILRFGTIFGTSKGMRFHTAINKFCWQAAGGLPITVWKQNYEHHRPYLGLNDAFNVIEFFLERVNEQKIWNQIYNVLSSNQKLSDIVEIIRKNIPDLDIKFIDTPLLNQYSYEICDKKIRKIGFIPEDDIKEHIDKTLLLLRNFGIEHEE